MKRIRCLQTTNIFWLSHSVGLLVKNTNYRKFLWPCFKFSDSVTWNYITICPVVNLIFVEIVLSDVASINRSCVIFQICLL